MSKIYDNGRNAPIFWLRRYEIFYARRVMREDYGGSRMLPVENERAITPERVIAIGSALYADRKEVCIAMRNLVLISELTWPSCSSSSCRKLQPGASKALNGFCEASFNDADVIDRRGHLSSYPCHSVRYNSWKTRSSAPSTIKKRQNAGQLWSSESVMCYQRFALFRSLRRSDLICTFEARLKPITI